MARTETYPVDVDPEQIIRWVKEEIEAKPLAFRISGRRAREAREIPVRRELRLGDAEREDLSEIATIAALEIAPFQASDGWRLTIAVEDEAGPRLADEEDSAAEEESIGLAAFCDEFISPGRGSAYAIAEVDGPAPRGRLTRLLNAIEQNRHRDPRGK
jgi:hypothetical protein